MNRLIPLALVLLSSQAYSCEEIKSAHEKLISSNFKLEKHFVLKLDDEKKIEETENLLYQDGRLNHKNNKTVFIAEDYKSDSGGDEIFLNTDFGCDDITRKNDVVLIRKQKNDVTFITEFNYDQATNTLEPFRTTMSGEVGVLFLSWSIDAVTSFKSFVKL